MAFKFNVDKFAKGVGKAAEKAAYAAAGGAELAAKGIGNLAGKVGDAIDKAKTEAEASQNNQQPVNYNTNEPNIRVVTVDNDGTESTGYGTADQGATANTGAEGTFFSEAGKFAKNVGQAVGNTAQDLYDSAKKNFNFPHKDESQASPQAERTADSTQIINNVISTKSVLKILYYLIAVDGTVDENESEMYSHIYESLDPNHEYDLDWIIQECKTLLNTAIDEEDFLDVAKNGVDEAINTSSITGTAFITPKMLIWNMLTVAYTGDDYDDVEKKLLKHTVRRLNVDKAVFLELESTAQALFDIEHELQWVKTTDRPYLVIEQRVKEIERRKAVISESVNALIAL